MEMAEIIYVRDANGNLVQTTIKDLREDRLEELEEENKSLKEENDRLKDNAMEDMRVQTKLEEENKKLKKENFVMKDRLKFGYKGVTREEIERVEEENKKLREFKEKREESMFYFKAQMERAEPKTAREAEDLQKAKELFEGIYRGELYYLEKENKQLKENIEMLSGNIILG